MVMGTEGLACDLLFVNEGTRKANTVIQPESEGLSTKSAKVREQEYMGDPAQAKRANSPFLCFFVLSRPSVDSVDWMMPTCSGESDLHSFFLFKY